MSTVTVALIRANVTNRNGVSFSLDVLKKVAEQIPGAEIKDEVLYVPVAVVPHILIDSKNGTISFQDEDGKMTLLG